MAATYEQLMTKARELAASGDTDGARRVAQIALSRKEGAAPQQAAKPWKTVLWENLVGDDDPTTQNVGETIGSLLNKAGESMTGGLIGDEASAGVESIFGSDYEARRDHYRDQERLVQENHPGLSLAADIGGAVAAPVGAIGMAGKGAGMLSKAARSAALTGAMSGLYGFTEGEGGASNRMDSAMRSGAGGAAIGAAVPVVGAGVQRVANSHAARKAIRDIAARAPSTDALRQQGQAAYQAVDDAGVQIKPEAFNRNTGKITDDLLASTGFDALPGPGSLTPNSARVMEIMRRSGDEMAQDPTAALPLKSLDQMRRQAGAAAGNMANKTDQQAGMRIIEGLDDFVDGLGADDVVAGELENLPGLIAKARDTWGRMSRSQLIDDAMSQEGNYLSGGASAIRNQFAKILRNPKLSRGFSDAEKKIMRRVVSGTIPEQIVNYLGSGLGMMGQMAGGAAIGGAPGALIGTALAAASRKGADAMTRRNAEIARAVVADGGLKAMPEATALGRLLTERLLRQGTAGALQPR